MVCEQAVRRGGFANVTDSMWLVLFFQGWYVVDGLYNEVSIYFCISSVEDLMPFSKPAIFTTMDITTDGFGFMLAVGDLTWVPFVYSLQARYLVFDQKVLGYPAAAAVLAARANGQNTVPVANTHNSEYIANITLGGREIPVLLDTGRYIIVHPSFAT